MNNASWVNEEFKNIGLDDGRIINRVIKVVKDLASAIGKSIPKASENWNDTKAAYNLVSNEKLTAEKVMQSHKQETIQRMKNQEIVLSVQDTTDLNYTSLKCTEGLGHQGGKENSRGLIMHSTLAVSTEGVPYGLLEQRIWARDPEERGKSKNCRKYPIEEKESYKWLGNMDTSREGVPENIKLVDVCDRDADLYEFLYKGITEKKSFVVRVKHNRLIEGEDKKLFKKLKSMPAAGEIIVEVPRNTRDKLPPHKVTLQVKSGSVGIIAPQYLPEKYKDTGTLSLNVIIVEEINPPQKKKPIKWILFTDMEVETLEQAVEKVKWYTHRWKIERFHYVLKSGCKVQDLQFETAERLIKVIALYSIVAWRVLWLVYESRQTPDISCEVVLETREWKVLDCIVNKKRVPRAKAPTLKEATLLIAKYGGFLARKGDGDPGVQVVWEGLRKLSTVMKNFDIINSIQLL